MKLSAILTPAIVFACGVALSAPAPAYASDGVAAPKHRIHVVRVAHIAVPSSATALAPDWFAPVVRRNDNSDGLSRDSDQCNRGCIDN
jgi:hypothetical protein